MENVLDCLSQEAVDPEATVEAILKLVDTADPPLRPGLGNTILPRARTAYAERLATWEAWEDVMAAAMGEPKKTVEPCIRQMLHAPSDQA